MEPEQLKRYAERYLNIEEIMQTVLHLDECRECFGNFQKMFPDLSDAAREIATEIFTADEMETFHLDYAEHLKPFVDSEADAVTREIVENHLQNCSFCAQAVRDLREFSESFHSPKTRKKSDTENSPKYFLPKFYGGNVWRLILPVIAILILGAGVWLIWQQSESQSLFVENQAPKINPPLTANENSINPPTENSRNAPKTNFPTSLRKKDGKSEKANSNVIQELESKQSKEENLIADLPTDLRAQVENVIRTQKVNLPPFIAELRAAQKLRGNSDAEQQNILAPNDQSVRFSAPIFRWRKFGDSEYVVTIYDKDFNQIAVSPILKDEKWRANLSLKRGKIYSWQVKSEKSSEFYTAQFKVLEIEAVQRLKKVENRTANSPLVRGIVYASEGLLNESALEFQKEIKKNPHDNLAEKLKNSLFRSRK